MRNRQLQLVSFDLDGTILQGRILDYLHIPQKLHDRIAAQDELFFQGRLGYEETLQIQFSLLSGLKADEIAPTPEKLPLIGDLGITLERFRDAGVRPVILTDNPSFAAEPLKGYGFQDVIASEIEISDGLLTQRMKLLTNKLDGLRAYCQQRGIQLDCCAHVGDWVNDVVVFKNVGCSVAFNPSGEEVLRAATYIVRSNSLSDVYRVLERNVSDR